MRTIYKYPLMYGPQHIALNAGAEIIHVAEQYGIMNMWVLLDQNKPSEQRLFSIVGTGQFVEDSAKYIGTFQQAGGDLVWHLFELPI